MKSLLFLLLLPALFFCSCSKDSCDLLQSSSLQIEFYQQDSLSDFLQPIYLDTTFDSIRVSVDTLAVNISANYLTTALNNGGTRIFRFYRQGTLQEILLQHDTRVVEDNGPGACGEYNQYHDLRIIKSDFLNTALKNSNSYNNDFTMVVIFP